MIRVTIAVPETMISAANELAKCIGYTEADGSTFGAVTHKDADGSLYSVASGLVEEAFLTNAFSPLVEPEWGADLDAAQEAQAKIKLWSDDAPVTASPDVIVAVISEDVGHVISLLGLSPV